ncbi:CD48 antigen-like, partial [Rhinichthys klamathensis goyatoka]|uniref:CD48 antigen-like n=1 Tax=Rhinichthys klamathensis goyatoka TaxID=3034132 RepID=UPI0024B4912C
MSLQLLTLISVVVFSTTEAASGQEVTKAVGDQVSFKLDKIVSPVTSITWKHLKAGELTVKAIEWEDGEETTVLNARFKGITTLNTGTGQITITNLTVAHTGVYTVDLSGKEQTQRFTLNVMEPVPKPVIKIEA